MARCRTCKKAINSRVCPHCGRSQRAYGPARYADDPFALGKSVRVKVDGATRRATILRVGRAMDSAHESANIWVRFDNGTLSAYPMFALLPDIPGPGEREGPQEPDTDPEQQPAWESQLA